MNKKQVIATAIGIGLVGAGIAGGFVLDNPETIVEEKIIEKEVKVEVPVIETIIQEKIVNVSTENPLNIEAMEKAQRLTLENKALKVFVEDEVDEDADIDYIIFESEAKMEAENWIEDEFINFLDDEDFFDNGEDLENYRESEVSVKTVYDPEVLDRDFDDKDLELKFEVKVKAKESGEDTEYFYYNVVIPFESGNIELDDIELI